MKTIDYFIKKISDEKDNISYFEMANKLFLSPLRYFIILSLLTICGKALPQPPDTQQTRIENLVDRYTESHMVWPLGKSYMHTDRTGYLPGDTVWFKAYCWSGNDGEPDTLSGVFHVELTGSDGRALEKKSCRLKQGQAHGEFVLPRSLESGDHYLRGWTRVSGDGTMVDPFYRRFTVRGADKGFYIGYDPVLVRGEGGGDSLEVRFRFYDLDPSGSLPSYYMHELGYRLKSGPGYLHTGQVKLSNTKEGVFRCSLSGLGDKDSTGVLEFMVKDERITYNRQFTIPLKDRLDLRFFPEGGDLVTGLGSRVAFKATGVDGHGKGVEGVVEDGDGKEIASFKSSHLGMGSFMLTPRPGTRYFARVAYQGSRYRFALPGTKEEGSIMEISLPGADSLLHVRILSRYAGDARRHVLLGCSKGQVRYAALVNPVGGLAVAKVPSGLFPEGLAVFTLMWDDFTPECERVVYIDHGQRIRLSVTPGSLTYGPRSRVSLDIKATDLSGSPVQCGLSLSVTDRGQSGDSLLQDIRAGKYLEGEVRGHIEDAGFYFEGDSCNHGALDMLLLTQGYRRFTGDTIKNNLNTINKIQKQLPEPERSFKVSGRLETQRKRLNGKKLDYRDLALMLARFGDEPYIGKGRPDSLGRFSMATPLGGGPFRVLLQVSTAKGKPFPGNIEVEEGVSPQLAGPPALPPYMPPLTVKQVQQQVQAARKIELPGTGIDMVRHIDLNEIVVTARRNNRDWSHDFKGEADKVADLDSLDPKGNKYKDLHDLLIKEFGARECMWIPGLRTVLFPVRCTDLTINLDYFYPIYVVNGIVYCNYGESGRIDLLGSLSIMKVSDIKKVMLIPPTSSLVASYAHPEIFKHMQQTIVYIETYSNNFYRGDPQGVKTFVMEGLASPREFYSPRYEGALKDSPVYDGRVTLFWAPEIVTDSLGRASVEFYTGDRPATLDIRVSGMGIVSGAPGEGRSAAEVKPTGQLLKKEQ
jgi:hypothetical protein